MNVRLPFTDPAVGGELGSDLSEAPAAPPPTVLLIEDSDGDALLLTECLEETGLTATRVVSLQSALAALVHSTFEFILTDLILPDATGLDAVHQLQASGAAAPIVVLTGIDDPDFAAKAVQAGAQDYLVKGQVDAVSLRRTLRHARERWQSYRELLHISRHDQLTGAVNRGALHECLEHAIAEAQRTHHQIAICYVDLDHFKAINDTLGHEAGDTVLMEIVARMRRELRAEDLVARLGGDEFAILMPAAGSSGDALSTAQCIRHAIERPIQVRGAMCVVTASMGVSLYPEVASSMDALLRAADTAMYRAKRSGRNRVELADGVSDAVSTLASDLQGALEHRQFILHYQPQYRIDTQRLIGFEALLRWKHPARGIIAPAVFIPLLEESGRITAVGEWVISEACRQLASWRRVVPDLRMAVNLSARDFDRPGLVAKVRDTLAQHGLPGCSLELEITESNLMNNTSQTTAILTELRAMGVRVSIDDFGTGFSSLSYLNRFPVDCLKIDRSLIENVHNGQSGSAIPNAIIALGHHLRLEVVAEGIETTSQLQLLTDAKCDMVQGYLLGRPEKAPSLAGIPWPLAAMPMGRTIPIWRVNR